MPPAQLPSGLPSSRLSPPAARAPSPRLATGPGCTCIQPERMREPPGGRMHPACCWVLVLWHQQFLGLSLWGGVSSLAGLHVTSLSLFCFHGAAQRTHPLLPVSAPLCTSERVGGFPSPPSQLPPPPPGAGWAKTAGVIHRRKLGK